MATSSRLERGLINPNLPIHSLSTLLSQASNTGSTPYSFHRRSTKLNQYPKQIDILHLLHDIHALNPLLLDSALRKLQIEIGSSKLLLARDLAGFVTFAVRTITSRYYYGAYAVESHITDTPNWMVLLYHNNVSSIDRKLSVISPILSLFDTASLYSAFDIAENQDIVSLISCLIVVRRHIPSSPLKGIDHRLLAHTAHTNEHHNPYIAIDHRHLFGEPLFGYLLHDLCQYIMTFLDLHSFFKCSTINSAWLHFIYRNDTFALIYKRMVSEQQRLQCRLLDHSILSQVHIPNTPLTIGWTLQCDNNSYLDFVTLKDHWFQSYVDLIDVTLQQRSATHEHVAWTDVKHTIKCSNEVGFDSFIMDQDDALQLEPDAHASDETEYRLKLEMAKPFKSRVIYSNTTRLKPHEWMARYNESKARDDMDVRDSSNRRLFHVHTFWFSFYVDLLHSMNTNVISDVLKNLRICQNRIRCDAEYLKTQYTAPLFKTLIRYVAHENHKIKLNAMRCLRRIAIQETKEMQKYYLSALAQHGLIRICERTLIRIRNERHPTLCSLREQMLWFIGYYIKTGCEWKSIILSEITDIDAFIRFIVEEIETNLNPKYTASYIWMLSKFFSLYHQSRSDDEMCDNHKVLNAPLGHVMVKLMWKSFCNAFAKYKTLRLEHCAQRRQRIQRQSHDEDEAEVQRQTQLDGWRCVLRDSYYGYSMALRYFNKEILDVVDRAMLKDIITGFDLAIDGMDGSEFALRMVRTSLSCCIDPVFRLNKYNQAIFAFGYLDKLYAILDAMIAKLAFIIMLKEKKIDIDMTMMDRFEDNDSTKPKEDQFMMLYPAILEAMPIIANNIGDICENDSVAQSKITKLLYLCVEVAVLHSEYLNVGDFSGESKEDRMIRKSDLQDQVCCTMAAIWDVMSRYGKPIRDYITENEKIMDLIEHQWAACDSTVTANQAQSLLTALQNDDVFDRLFDGSSNHKSCDRSLVVLCPCGDTLKLKEAKDCYQATAYCYLYCDYCREKIDWKLNPKRMVYHCDKKENIHPHGFDLCINCSKRKYFLDRN